MQMKTKSKDSVASTDGKLTRSFAKMITITKENPRPTKPIRNPHTIPTKSTITKVFIVIGMSTLGVSFFSFST